MVRRAADWQFGCKAPDELFEDDWQETCPQEVLSMVIGRGLRCEGSGSIGPWCEDCQFGVGQYIEEAEWFE